mmetsp:Transcript_8635/g.14610  ORF Transcript_8635/g.14610 Transcript_8635/m.14610 type:complete len:130 (+) Transcript_8635:232-621(+)
MELSHRKPEFTFISDMCKVEIRRLLDVPDNFTVMLNQGGATNQYTAVVKNLIGLKPKRKAMYLTTGLWSLQCITEAKKLIPAEDIVEVANGQPGGFLEIPDPQTWNIDGDASYFHVCWNETVNGLEFSN